MPPLPRVTYSNIAEDFSGVHAHLDGLLPKVRADILGRTRANLIGGREDDDGAPYGAPSPIDRDWPLGRFVAASPGAVDRAVKAAGGAYPDWSRRPWPERVAYLRAVADVVEARKYEISAACLFEVGKSRLEAMGEVEETVDLIRYYAGEMEENAGYDRPMRRAFPREATRSVLRPHGVFAVIAPFNFPVALSAAMISGALLGGNTVVYKPSPMAGLTGRLLVDAFTEAGLPAGALNLVCGGAEVGEALVDHPSVAGVAFTGSHAVGMAIFRRMAARPYARPVVAEMGGKNPTYVTASADLDAASSGVMRSAFGLSGQKCSASSTVFVHDAVADDFLGALAVT
jgi:1-pyrroline-5-carboxylate dehydrogenase